MRRRDRDKAWAGEDWRQWFTDVTEDDREIGVNGFKKIGITGLEQGDYHDAWHPSVEAERRMLWALLEDVRATFLKAALHLRQYGRILREKREARPAPAPGQKRIGRPPGSQKSRLERQVDEDLGWLCGENPGEGEEVLMPFATVCELLDLDEAAARGAILAPWRRARSAATDTGAAWDGQAMRQERYRKISRGRGDARAADAPERRVATEKKRQARLERARQDVARAGA